MAAFYSYSCLWKNCGKTCVCLQDLIEHVEDVHVDKDAPSVDKFDNLTPPALALSHILRFFTEAAKQVRRKEMAAQLAHSSCKSGHSHDRGRSSSITDDGIGNDAATTGDASLSIDSITSVTNATGKGNSNSNVSGGGGTNTASNKSSASHHNTSSDLFQSDDSDSDESWTTNESFSSDAILSMMATDESLEKPFACPVPNCNKRYKNVNGMKYHAKNGHKKEIRVRKGYRCRCKKSYRTAVALKNHCVKLHQANPNGSLPEQSRSLEIDLISNMPSSS